MITERDAAVCGKLSALEFIVEVMLANQLAHLTAATAQGFLDDLVSRPGYLKSGPVAVDEMQAIEAESQATLQNLAEKVASRADQIRARITHGL